MYSKNHRAHFMSNVTMHNMHWQYSRITTSAKSQPQFIYSFIKKQRRLLKNQCKHVCVIWYDNYSLVAIKNNIMCGITRVSASSKKRLNSSRICIVPSSLYSKHGDMLPSHFNMPLKTIFEYFYFAILSRICYRVFEGLLCLLDLLKIDQSEQEFLMQATCLSRQGTHN